MAKLERLKLSGFKSIREMDLELRDMNVLIGANGAGKSNLISFFKLLNELTANRLERFVREAGDAHSLLYRGPKVTCQIDAELMFTSEAGHEEYSIRLSDTAADKLVIDQETFGLFRRDWDVDAQLRGSGRSETGLNALVDRDKEVDPHSPAHVLRSLLEACRVYHFHDTSMTAAVRRSSFSGNNRPLGTNAENLPAFLLRLRQTNGGSAYKRIVTTTRLIAPFFDDFVFESAAPDQLYVQLNWRERGSDQVFGPHQLSDGTLRAICLIALLLQPEEELPRVIVIDEPELGLHPYALGVIASLLKKASTHAQVLVSTQSAALLDHFEPQDVIVADREDDQSIFKRLNADELQSWLEEYSLGEVWEKNVVGGGPH